MVVIEAPQLLLHVTKLAAPSGSCLQSVHIGGNMQSSGHGIWMTQIAPGVDQLVEFDIVFANGDMETVTETSHPELFRAVRGGGPGAFGIITRSGSFFFKKKYEDSV
jgi:FAD/FMN-containing dehydrogenase